MAERRDIGWRLENWSKWCHAQGGRGPDCMTGAICESLRKNALGDVWSGHQVHDETDDQDAVRIERGMRVLQLQQRLLLYWCYIEQAPQHIVCRKVGIPARPASEFVERFRAAQEAIEDAVDNEGNR